jgi:hypothetical protein
VGWICLLIDLFKDTRLINENSKNLGLLRNRKCDVMEDLSYYEQEVACSIDKGFHISSVLSNKDAPRSYFDFYGKISDSHNEIEKLGVCKYAKPYTTILSLEDSLDYILHRLCKADIAKVRSISEYDLLSRSLLKLNFDGMKGFTFEEFFKADTNVEKFLLSMYNSVPSESEDKNHDFLLSFVSSLIKEVSAVAEYISFAYNASLDKDTSVIRSKSFCSFVLTTSNKLEDELVIRSDGFDDYSLKVRSFERKEYLSGLELKYSE